MEMLDLMKLRVLLQELQEEVDSSSFIQIERLIKIIEEKERKKQKK